MNKLKSVTASELLSLSSTNKWYAKKITVCEDVMPCSVTDKTNVLEVPDAYILTIQVACSSKTLVPTYPAMWHHLPEHYSLHTHCHENFELSNWYIGISSDMPVQ